MKLYTSRIVLALCQTVIRHPLARVGGGLGRGRGRGGCICTLLRHSRRCRGLFPLLARALINAWTNADRPNQSDPEAGLREGSRDVTGRRTQVCRRSSGHVPLAEAGSLLRRFSAERGDPQTGLFLRAPLADARGVCTARTSNMVFRGQSMARTRGPCSDVRAAPLRFRRAVC